MSNCLITGYWGEPHVTAENDRGINAAIFGAGRFVLPVGERFRAECIGNNLVRLYDGKLLDNGAAAGIPAGEHIDLPLSLASSGKKRNDLVIFQYRQDISTLVETGHFVVLQGEETVETPVDPEVVQSDLLSNKATLDQMPLYRIVVSDTEVSAPVQLFTLAKNMMEVEEIAKNSSSSGGGSEGGSGTTTDEVLPIAKGGTGAKTAADALANLGAAPAQHEHSAESISGLAATLSNLPKIAYGSYSGKGNTTKGLSFDFAPKMVIVTSNNALNGTFLALVRGATNARILTGSNDAKFSPVTVTWDDDGVSWSGGTAYAAANAEYMSYSYAAFG